MPKAGAAKKASPKKKAATSTDSGAGTEKSTLGDLDALSSLKQKWIRVKIINPYLYSIANTNLI